MLRAIDVANFFIYLNKREFEQGFTNKYLNHLVYLAYGWFYAKNNLVLFQEKIYAKNNYIEIENVLSNFSDNDLIKEYCGIFDISIFVSKEIELLIAIYDYYSQFSSNYIQKIICHKNSPWFLKDKNTCIIDPILIFDFFVERQYFDNIS